MKNYFLPIILLNLGNNTRQGYSYSGMPTGTCRPMQSIKQCHINDLE